MKTYCQNKCGSTKHQPHAENFTDIPMEMPKTQLNRRNMNKAARECWAVYEEDYSLLQVTDVNQY